MIMRDITLIDNLRGLNLMMDGGETHLGRIEAYDIKIYGETASPDCPPKGGFCN